MENDTYKAALAKATEELNSSLKQKQDIEAKILKLRQTIAALSALCQEIPQSPLNWPLPPLPVLSSWPPALIPDFGLTASIRSVLTAAGESGLTPVAVKEKLDAAGFDWKDYTQPMSAVHTVLKRLVDAGQANTETVDGRTVYRWTGGPPRRFVRRRRYVRGAVK